jgi:hypothetical protein
LPRRMDALGGTALLHRYRAMIRRPIVEPAPREPGRARKAREHAAAAMQPASNGYIVPPVPAGLSAIRKWLRRQHDAYSRRQLTGPELNECRYTMRAIADSYRASAEVRKSEAVLRAAEAQEHMADVLAQVEHGSAAFVLLERLKNEVDTGPRRPLPGVRRAVRSRASPRRGGRRAWTPGCRVGSPTTSGVRPCATSSAPACHGQLRWRWSATAPRRSIDATQAWMRRCSTKEGQNWRHMKCVPGFAKAHRAAMTLVTALTW